MAELTIASVEIFPIRLALHEPFAVAYATAYDVPTILVRVTTTGRADRMGRGDPGPERDRRDISQHGRGP